MANKIVLNTKSDVNLSAYDINIKKQDDTFTVTKSSNNYGVTANISASKNTSTNIKELILTAKAQYKNGSNKTVDIETPFITIIQQSHPKYYVEGETKVSENSFDEFGGTFIISTYAKQEDNPKNIVNSNYFSIEISGDCARYISEPKETEDALIWEVTIEKNPDLVNKSLLIKVNFDDGNDSQWSSETLTVTQSAHVQIKTAPVFNATPTLVDYTGGDVTVTSYYTIDGIQTPINPVSISASTFVEGTDYIFSESADTITRTLRILENTSSETPNGEANKSMILYIVNPLDDNKEDIITIGPIQQKTKKQGVYVFNFSDGSLEKKYLSPFSYNEQEIEVGIISTRQDGDNIETLGVTCSYSNSAVISAQPEFNNSVLTFKINENSNEARECVITIRQDKTSGQSITMPDLKLYISQFAKEEEGVLPNFDYMIMTIGSDMLCGRDLDIMVYAKDMPSEYEYYKCVGFKASEYLKNVEFPSTEFEFSDFGDIKNNTLQWAGDNITIGAESVLLSPKKILTEEFILAQMKNNKKEFDVDVYGNFYFSLYTGISTIKIQAYKSDNDAVIVDNPYSDDASLFQPDDSAKLVFEGVYNAKISSEGEGKEQIFKDSGGYTKIGTLRYTYSSGIWSFLQDDSVVLKPKESEKESYRNEISSKSYLENIYHRGMTKLYGEYIFGCLHEKNENKMYDFFTVGAAGYGQINSEHKQHTFDMFSFYYDQTKYQITKIAILPNKESPKESDWIDNFDIGSTEWIVSGDNKNDDNLWIYWEEINVSKPISENMIERSTYHKGLSISSLPTYEITGHLYDPDTKITSEFNIESGYTSNRKISWKDTANGDKSLSKYVLLKDINYNAKEFELLGIAKYDTTPPKEALEEFKDFKYYYNSTQKNIMFQWGLVPVKLGKRLGLYVYGSSGFDMAIVVNYGFSNSKNVEPTLWTSKSFSLKKSTGLQLAGGFTINEVSKSYLWFKLSASDNVNSYGPCKVWELFNMNEEYIIYDPKGDECYITDIKPF